MAKKQRVKERAQIQRVKERPTATLTASRTMIKKNKERQVTNTTGVRRRTRSARRRHRSERRRRARSRGGRRNGEDEPDPEEDEGTAPEHHEQGAPRYNLQTRNPARHAIFNKAMDQPHGDKSYYPPMQLMQDGQVNIIAVFGYIMNQISAKVAIRKHGKAAKDARMAEFAQMEDLNVYEPVHASSLTPQQRRGALRAITIVKEK